jgi:hypothetical protein
MSADVMTPEEFKVKVEELRLLIVEKLAELEEEAKWGTPDEREEVAEALDELAVQADALSAALQEEE